MLPSAAWPFILLYLNVSGRKDPGNVYMDVESGAQVEHGHTCDLTFMSCVWGQWSRRFKLELSIRIIIYLPTYPATYKPIHDP